MEDLTYKIVSQVYRRYGMAMTYLPISRKKKYRRAASTMDLLLQ